MGIEYNRCTLVEAYIRLYMEKNGFHFMLLKFRNLRLSVKFRKTITDMNIGLNKQYGFTLIEFVCVIAIIGILSILVAPSWSGTSLGMIGQAQELANDIRYAQNLAMTTGQRYRWVKTASNTYQIQNNFGTAIVLTQGRTTVTFRTGMHSVL